MLRTEQARDLRAVDVGSLGAALNHELQRVVRELAQQSVWHDLFNNARLVLVVDAHDERVKCSRLRVVLVHALQLVLNPVSKSSNANKQLRNQKKQFENE